jgi:hypothetical protein
MKQQWQTSGVGTGSVTWDSGQVLLPICVQYLLYKVFVNYILMVMVIMILVQLSEDVWWSSH